MTEEIELKPTMLYDGDCGFCVHWVARWQKMTGDAITYAPYQEARRHFPQVKEEACREAVQLIFADGQVVSGAHAVLKSLSLAGRMSFFHWSYDNLPLFGRIAELIYQWIGHHRFLFSRLFYSPINKCE